MDRPLNREASPSRVNAGRGVVTSKAPDTGEVERLIDASSLGSPEVKRAIADIPEDDPAVRQIMAHVSARLAEDNAIRLRSAEEVQASCGCGPCGSSETYAHQVRMPLIDFQSGGTRVRCIDHCIHDIIAALNAAGVHTVASCCGHGKLDGRITLEDGRELLVVLPGVREVR